MSMNIGIVGGGAVAKFLLKAIKQDMHTDLHINSIYIRHEEKYHHLTEEYHVQLYTDLDEFLHSDIDIVVEAAQIEAVQALVPCILKHKDVIVISIGALADQEFFEKIYSLAEAYGRSIYLPSGAIGGLDLLQNAHALGGVSDVSLVTWKP